MHRPLNGMGLKEHYLASREAYARWMEEGGISLAEYVLVGGVVVVIVIVTLIVLGNQTDALFYAWGT